MSAGSGLGCVQRTCVMASATANCCVGPVRVLRVLAAREFSGGGKCLETPVNLRKQNSAPPF